MKVLFLTYIPAPYRVDFFNELGRYCDLTVVFEKGSAGHRDNSWKTFSFDSFKGIILDSTSKKPDFRVCTYIDNTYDHIIVHEISTPTGILAVEYLKFRKLDFWIEIDGGFAKNGRGLKELIKTHIISGAKGYFSPCKAGDEYLHTYGAHANRIFRYPFSSIKEDKLSVCSVSDETVIRIREKLGIRSQYVVLSVGQFIPRKGFDVLIKAAKNFPEGTCVYIIGGVATSEYLSLIEQMHLNNIHFVSYLLPEELAEYYKMADLFILPTREDIWGLVINEAMAYGLPVITTKKCGAGQELITNGENGYIINPEDVDAISEMASRILLDEGLRRKMRDNNLVTIRRYTIEKMVKKHLELLRG